MKRALLVLGGTVGGLASVLAYTPPQFGSSGSSLALLPLAHTGTPTTPATSTPANSAPNISGKQGTPTQDTTGNPVSPVIATSAPAPVLTKKSAIVTVVTARKPNHISQQNPTISGISVTSNEENESDDQDNEENEGDDQDNEDEYFSAGTTPTLAPAPTPIPTPTTSSTSTPQSVPSGTPTSVTVKTVTKTVINPKTVVKPKTTVVKAPTVKSTPIATKTSTPVATKPSGIFTGSVVNIGFGNVQVQITVTNGKITASRALQSPSGGRSSSINQQAIPMLNQQVVQAQSANIQGVSGASYTSQGYQSSLSSALSQAKL